MRKNSLNDVHLLNCISSILINDSNLPSNIKILDIGCGSGRLIHTLYKNLKKDFPSQSFEIYGMDVVDSGFIHDSSTPKGYILDAIQDLGSDFPEINWSERIKLISSKDAWPYKENFFDFIVSNQVFEHINNKKFTFSSIDKFLKNNGHSFHLAQVKECLWEFHIQKPFAHWIRSEKMLYFYIYSINILKNPFNAFQAKNRTKLHSLNETKFMLNQTSYASVKTLKNLAESSDLSSDFDTSVFYYLIKLKKIFNRNAVSKFKYTALPATFNTFLLFFLKRISSVTLHLKKNKTS